MKDIEECDHCHQDLHRDSNGWWVGEDDTAECPVNEQGHEVEGLYR